MKPRKAVLFDCDPGVDDAVALLLAFAATDEIDLIGITTVAGNVSAGLTARNACLIRDHAGRRDVPVYAGAERPLRREPVEAGHFHGETGLGDLPISEPKQGVTPGHAVDFIESTLRSAIDAGQKVCIVITGPMTNVASALRRDPRLLEGIECFAIMGGARSEGGNITASAEYNIYADPDAAQYVFNAGPVVYAFGLDATHQVRATPARTARIRDLGSAEARAAAQLLEFSNALPANGPREQGAPLHDPCPIAWLLAPQLFKFKPCHIDVELDSSLTLGHTAVEFRATGSRLQNVQWAVEADAEGVFALLERYLASGRSGKA
ncbi:MAG: nucleoside hydrolase [Sinobacteraceae bacterium]|nr:nucleoside hydrolase [Nevskiaceae bacterium]